MCGGGATTTTNSQGEIPDWIKSASKGNISAAKDYAKKWGVDQPLEKTAYGGIKENADYANSMMPYQQALIQSLYQGGGMGEGANAIRSAWDQTSPVYSQYLQAGYLDPMSNPYTQPSIEAARASGYNDVADRFSQAGRSFSGAEAGAYGRAAANAALPILMGQYNTNVGAQQNAAQGLLGAAQGTSGGLDAAQQNVLHAMMSAPGQLTNLNIPENMQLGIVDRQRQVAQQALAQRIAALSGAPYASGSTSTTTQGSDPFQTLVGGGLGLLGMFV